MNYEYNCSKCGYIFERNLPIEDRDCPINEPCPKCKKLAVNRVMAAPFFSYEGGKTLEQRARAGAGSDFVDAMKSIRKRHPQKLRDGTKQTITY